jgi:thiamine biosynthesis lipoprotein
MKADGGAKPASRVQEDAEKAITDAFDLCAELDKTLSRTAEASDVSRINNAGGEWTEVSDYTLDLLQAGVRYSELSGGDFDITIGGVTDLWDFHADPEDARVPDADTLAEAVKHVGYKNIEIDGSRVRITDPDARIDLGGIAKGYIGDRMTEVLEAEGVTSAIINLGGNVICIGAKDNSADGDEGNFVIGVEAPYSDRSEIVGKVKARDMTLVTSGVYERQIEVDGKTYHHILSTKTGYSVETDLDAVTLAGAKGQSMDLDALSTICLIKGHDEAKKLIEGIDGIEAVFIMHDGSTDKTSGMEFEPADN